MLYPHSLAGHSVHHRVLIGSRRHDRPLWMHRADCSWLRCRVGTKLSLQRDVQVSDSTHFLLDLLPFLADLNFVSLHSLVHLIK